MPYFFLVIRLDININKTQYKQRTLQVGHRGQCHGYKPHIRPAIYILSKHFNQINRGWGIKNNKIFPHKAAPPSQKIGAFVCLSKNMDHPSLGEPCQEGPAIM